MSNWIETKFADVLDRLLQLRASGATDPQTTELADIVDDVTRQVTNELQDHDARLQHLEHHLRTTSPTPKK